MKRAYCVIIRACSVSFLAGHSGALIIALALVGTASLASPAWGQWTTGSGGTIYYNGGNVGIGTTTPKESLAVTGQGLFLPTNISWDPGDAAGSALRLGYYSYGDYAYIIASNTGVAAKNLILQPTGYGNVGIGETNPQYFLSVKGTVGAEEFIVTNTGWSDYVFQPGYRLRPLSEVGAYIQANHHLPDIPSETEVKEKGVSVGEMQTKLLAKVEELTLHMIQQEKENQELRERISRLEKGAAGDATPRAAK